MKVLLCMLLLMTTVMTYGKKKNKLVEIETNMGTIKVRLYESTPKHAENFLRLCKEHHYDSLLFHRVIKDFMIQGGASDSRGASKDKMLGMVAPDYTIDAEFVPGNIHKKGALAAARQGDEVNPEKKSSGEQFYVVQGKTYTDAEMDQMEKRQLSMAKNQLGTKLYKPKQEEHRRYLQSGQKAKADSLVQSVNNEIEAQFKDYKKHLIPADIREIYKTVGGTPFLDGDYTVFGEVVEGMEVIDKIAAVETATADRPVKDVVILGMKLKRK